MLSCVKSENDRQEKFSHIVVIWNILLNTNSCVQIIPGLGFKDSWMSFCCRFGNGGACLFEVKRDLFRAKGSSNSTFKVLPNEGWLLLLYWLMHFAPLSNHTNPKCFLTLAFLAIPKTVPEIWVASVSLDLFFLLFTHFTTSHRSLLKSSRYSLEPFAFSLLWFGNRDLFSMRDSWRVLQEMWHFNDVNE